MEEDLSRIRPRIHALQDSANWLIDKNEDDRVAVSSIKNQLTTIIDPVNELAEKLNEKQNILQSSLLQTQEFQTIYDDCMDKISKAEVIMSREKPLSLKYCILWKQDENFRVFEVDLTQINPSIEMLSKSVKKIKDLSEGENVKDAENKIKELIKRRDVLCCKVKEKRDEFDTLLPAAKEHEVTEDVLKKTLGELGSEYKGVQVIPRSQQECENQIIRINELKKNLDAALPKYKHFSFTFDNLKSTAKKIKETTDEPLLKEDFLNLNKQWDSLQVSVIETSDQINKMQHCFSKFQEARKVVCDELDHYEVFIENIRPFGLNIAEGKEVLIHCEDFLKNIEKITRALELTNRNAKDLTDIYKNFGADPWSINADVADMSHRFEEVKKRLQQHKNKLVDEVRAVDKFSSCTLQFDEWIKIFTEKFNLLQPISTTPECIKQQINEVEEMLKDIDGNNLKLKELQEFSDDVCKNNIGDFAVKSETDLKLNKVKEPMLRMRTKLIERKAKLENLLVDSQELHDSCDDFSDKLTQIKKQVNKLKLVSAKYTIVKKQYESTVFFLEEIHQLEPIYQRLEKAAEKVLLGNNSSEEKSLNEKIKELQKIWVELQLSVKHKKEKIEFVLPLSNEYEKSTQEFSNWLNNTEQKLIFDSDRELKSKELIDKKMETLKVLTFLILFC